ncbi:MAG: hypothetical protein HY924_05165 [Elusimicrobia bacterium]|nr:hypothetical protein [Elusimicrobiota bacterium]
MKRAPLFVPLVVFAVFCGAVPVSAADDKKSAQEAPKTDRPLTALAKLAATSSSAREDMAKRFSKFMLEGPYVADEARKDGLEARLAAMPKAWVAEKFKGNDAAKLAVVRLYYVLGEPSAPKWAQGKPELEDAVGGFEREKLEAGMKPWTLDSGGQAATNPGVKAGPLAKMDGKAVDWVNRFLDSAAEQARLIIEGASISKDKKLESVNGLDEKSPVQTDLGARRRSMTASAGYGDADLFEGGAFKQLIFQEGDKTSREISVKLISYKTETGVENQVAVCDVTYADDKFCRRFPINRQGGETTFALDDRKPGQRKYTLKFETDKEGVHVSFGRPEGIKDPDNNGVIRATVQEFAVKRAQHVLEMNRVVVINGVEYLVAGQSAGSTGEHLYYRKDSLQSTEVDDLKPEFVAQVVAKGAIAKHKVILGKVNGKDFHTYWDPVDRKFKIGDGPGVEPTPPSVGTGTTNPQPGTGTTNPQPGEGGGPSSGEFDPIEDQFLNTGYYAPNREVNKAIVPVGVARVHSITAKGETWARQEFPTDYFARRHIIFIPGVTKKALYVKFEQNEKGFFAEGNPPIQVVKNLGYSYLKTVSDGGQHFYNLKGKADPESGFPVSGKMKFRDGVKSIAMADVNDAEILKLLLGEILKEADVEKALANLAQVSKGRKLANISGTAAALVAVFDTPPNAMFWPKVGDAPNTGGNYADATGKGETIFEGASGGPREPFKDSVEVGPADKLEKLTVYNGLKKANAVLYVNAVEKGKGTKDAPRKWFVQFNFKNPGGTPNNPNQDYRSAFIEVPLTEGGQSVPFPYEAKTPTRKGDKDVIVDVDINEDGVTVLTEAQSKLDLNKTGTHGRYVQNPAANGQKGVYAVFATGARDARDKKENCLAPLFWWGMDKKAAVEACQADSY